MQRAFNQQRLEPSILPSSHCTSLMGPSCQSNAKLLQGRLGPHSYHPLLSTLPPCPFCSSQASPTLCECCCGWHVAVYSPDYHHYLSLVDCYGSIGKTQTFLNYSFLRSSSVKSLFRRIFVALAVNLVHLFQNFVLTFSFLLAC